LHLAQTHKTLVLLLTFLCYTSFHASRKPMSVVKSVLTGVGGNDTLTSYIAADSWPWLQEGTLTICHSSHFCLFLLCAHRRQPHASAAAMGRQKNEFGDQQPTFQFMLVQHRNAMNIAGAQI